MRCNLANTGFVCCYFISHYYRNLILERIPVKAVYKSVYSCHQVIEIVSWKTEFDKNRGNGTRTQTYFT